MKKRTQTLFAGALLAVSLLASSVAAASDIVVGSWNVKRMGHGDQQRFPALAAVASKVDLIALEEVMNEQGLANLEAALEKQTGESWSTLVSHAVGSNGYKEMYAFAWRDKAVQYEDGAVVYMDRGNVFIREPFSARFKSRRDGSELALGAVHILYGKDAADRTPEIRALGDYWNWMGQVYPGTPRLLVGDFNMPPSDPAWADLKQYAKPLITRGASTLSAQDGRYASLYDNIWVEKDSKLKISAAGIIDYPKLIGWDHEKSRKHVSDHAPVFVALGNARLTGASVAVPALGDAPAATVAATIPHQPAQAEGGALDGGAGGSSAVRGNSVSHIFHRSDCPSYNQVSAKNRVEFPSAAAAQAAGYRLAGNCR